jgi:hypothetical protein
VIERLRARGYGFEGEFLLVEGVPVRFIPADDSTGLRAEALAQAVEHRYRGSVTTWILRPEYLAALALATHRPKDYERVYRLLTEAAPDQPALEDLIARYELRPYWDEFVRRYPEAVDAGPRPT